MKNILKTTYPCLVVTQEKAFELDPNDTLEIENEDFVFVYPENRMAFAINLKSPKENAFFSVFPNDNHTLIVLEDNFSIQVTEKMRLNINGKVCDVEVCQNEISFQTATKKVSHVCAHKCVNPKIFKLKNFACVQFDQNLYAFSLKNNKLSHFCGEISLSGDELTLRREFNDSENRVRTAVYHFGDEIELVQENFESVERKMSADLVPFKLMESVLAKDFAHAFGFLSDRLKSHVAVEQIKEFFGNFSKFLPLSTTEFITLGKEKNYVKFSMEQDKIDDISVDSL